MMNREQITQALKCCGNHGSPKCKECPMEEGRGCAVRLYREALAYINRQEAEYNELYELLQTYKADSEAYRSYSKTLEKENEALKTLLDESYDTQNALTKENERLIDELAKSYGALDEAVSFYCSFTKSKIQNCPIDDEVAKAKTDTVRKMQERLKAELSFGRHIQADQIDQIAKEILNESK